ncbi:MAG: hypothetical protein FJZ79_07525 [Chlorobi bacterium]|nr:hypothetical protein [Chlorobiota bacterium]
MPENQQNKVNYALVRITTEQISLSPENIEQDKPVKINAGLNFGIDPAKKLIKVLFKNDFEQENRPFITIEMSCIFALDPASWDLFINDQQELFVLPKGFAGHLASIAAGTARGILHHATENTPLNRFFIPANNVEAMIGEHVALPLNPEGRN